MHKQIIFMLFCIKKGSWFSPDILHSTNQNCLHLPTDHQSDQHKQDHTITYSSHKSHAIQFSPSKYTFLHCGHIIWSDWSVLFFDLTADFLHFFLDTTFCVELDFLFINVLLVPGNSRPPPCLFLWVLRLLFPPYWLTSFDTTFFPQSFWFFFPKFLKMSFRNSLLLIYRNLETIFSCNSTLFILIESSSVTAVNLTLSKVLSHCFRSSVSF